MNKIVITPETGEQEEVPMAPEEEALYQAIQDVLNAQAQVESERQAKVAFVRDESNTAKARITALLDILGVG